MEKVDVIDVINELSDVIDADVEDDVVVEDPDVILQKNINKANILLDNILDGLNIKVTVGMAEVASLLINSITNAVDKMYAGSFNFDSVQVKKGMMGLKEKELLIRDKALLIKGGSGNESNTVPTQNNNILIADREAVMELLKDSEVKKQLTNEEVKNCDE